MNHFYSQIKKLSKKLTVNEIINRKVDYIDGVKRGFSLLIIDDYWIWMKNYEQFSQSLKSKQDNKAIY